MIFQLHLHWTTCLINMKLYLFTLFLGICVNVAAPAALSVCSGPLPNVPNAVVTEESKKNEYKAGDTIYFSCNFGYIIAGRISYVCGNNRWQSPQKKGCSPKPCELPDETANGHYLISVGDDFVFGATIKYTCNDGYQMVSKTDTRTCMLEGWSNHLPICEVVSCVPEATDGRVVVSGIPDDNTPILFGHELSFNCPKPEHQLNGNPQVVCSAGGRWNQPFPTCEDVTCKYGEIHNNVIVEGGPPNNITMKYGNKLKFECSNPKYILHGESEVVCSTNGHWSHPFPTCNEPANVCGPPPNLNNGDTVHRKDQYRNGESVEYECQKYYIRSGESHKTCRNGIWVGVITCLEPCTVNDQLMAERNIAFAYYTKDPNKLYATHNDWITFKCIGNKRGTPDSVDFHQQCLNGFMNLPQCQ